MQTPRDLQDLYAAFEAVDNVVLKKYVADLSQAPCIPISDELKALRIGDNVAMYRIDSIVYDKNENIQDKLTTVYSGIFSLRNCGILMLINAKKDHADLYVGVVTRELIARDNDGSKDVPLVDEADCSRNGKVLKNAFLGNFAGAKLIPVKNETDNSAPLYRDRLDIPNQLSGQEGTKVLLTTSDIKGAPDGLAARVCNRYDANLVALDVSVYSVEKAIKEVAGE